MSSTFFIFYKVIPLLPLRHLAPNLPNYNKRQLVTLSTADEAAPSYYAVWFGGTDVAGQDPTPTGNLGKFSFKGTMSKPYVTGAGVNEARSISISIAPATPVSFEYQ